MHGTEFQQSLSILHHRSHKRRFCDRAGNDFYIHLKELHTSLVAHHSCVLLGKQQQLSHAIPHLSNLHKSHAYFTHLSPDSFRRQASMRVTWFRGLPAAPLYIFAIPSNSHPPQPLHQHNLRFSQNIPAHPRLEFNSEALLPPEHSSSDQHSPSSTPCRLSGTLRPRRRYVAYP